jgi:diguanylate cyclase (GGDEF)-like protein
MPTMSKAALLLFVILLQQSLFGLLWMVSARLRLARPSALHWALAAWLVAAGMGLVLLRGRAPAWLTVAAANALLIASFVALRRGIQRFARLRPTDREHALVLLLGGVGLAAIVATRDSLLPAVMLAAAGMGWTLLRAAHEVCYRLADEFGRAAAAWCAVPLVLVAVSIVVRGLLAPFHPELLARYAGHPGGDNVPVAFGSLAFGLVLHVSLTALVLLRLVRKLQHRSDHDTLTGLLGRRPMEQRLRAEAQRQRRFGGRFALLSIDIDHFKQVNDQFGHAAGDAVLVRVAQALREAAREVDSVARMGGEEFCVLLPGTDRAGAEAVAARMLDAVRALRHPEAPDLAPVTVSIGLALVDAPAESLQAVQRRLDQALYGAKAGGRDRIQHAAAPAPAPAEPTEPVACA